MFARFMQKVERDPAFNSIATIKFPPLPDDLLARMSCPDYSLEDPDMTMLEKLFDGFIKSDTTKTRQLKDPAVRKQQEEKKKKFFERLRSVFKRKR
ncbi:MAG: hypothetical protein HOC82_02205, partial [Bacteroidetes bacterium]|nr:hypothetical protein [Bacteroidota bacterium]